MKPRVMLKNPLLTDLSAGTQWRFADVARLPHNPPSVKASAKGDLMAVVLCTGTDDLLLASRRMLLERAGHTVVSALGTHSVQYACRRAGFDVAVIGQGCTEKEKGEFLSLIRQHCPGAKVLELYLAHSHPALKDADAHLEVPAELTSDFVDRVNALATRGPAGKAR